MIKRKIKKNPDSIKNLINKKVIIILQSNSGLEHASIKGVLKRYGQTIYSVHTSDKNGSVDFYDTMIKNIDLNTIRVEL